MKIEWNKVTWYSKLVAVIIIVGVFALGFWLGTQKAEKVYIEVPHIIYRAPEASIVGGDRDEHGCIGSAGYSWCETKQKCLRIWEESCERTASTEEVNDLP